MMCQIGRFFCRIPDESSPTNGCSSPHKIPHSCPISNIFICKNIHTIRLGPPGLAHTPLSLRWRSGKNIRPLNKVVEYLLIRFNSRAKEEKEVSHERCLLAHCY